MKGNKGEWTELYVLLSLIADGTLFQSDIELNKDENNVYHIIKGFKNETNYSLTFSREKENISIIKNENNDSEIIKTISFEDMKILSEDIYNGIISGKGRSFTIENVSELLSSFNIKNLKEKSTEKADIKLKIYDHRLAKETDLGFSIKSLIGGNSTLFNPGTKTNFIFEIIPKEKLDVSDFNKKTYKPTTNESKIAYRLKLLEKNNAEFKYLKVQSEQLWMNLKMIDGDLPEIIAYALYFRWLYQTPSLLDVSQKLEEIDPLDFYKGKKSDQRLYEYKIMRFLTECGMGMTSETAWMGEYDNFGGVIVAKEDGDIVAFHIYDFNLFRKYLINNTIFEQPATGEDKNNPGSPDKNSKKKYNYGWLYEDDDKLQFKINLQIRFK